MAGRISGGKRTVRRSEGYKGSPGTPCRACASYRKWPDVRWSDEWTRVHDVHIRHIRDGSPDWDVLPFGQRSVIGNRRSVTNTSRNEFPTRL